MNTLVAKNRLPLKTVELACEFDLGINKLRIKTSSGAIILVSFLLLVGSIAVGETRIGDHEMLARQSIIRNVKKEAILKNRNIDFKELSQIEIITGNTLVECFFGYQNENRVVLCY